MLPRTFDPLSPTYRSQFVARVPETHKPRRPVPIAHSRGGRTLLTSGLGTATVMPSSKSTAKAGGRQTRPAPLQMPE